MIWKWTDRCTYGRGDGRTDRQKNVGNDKGNGRRNE